MKKTINVTKSDIETGQANDCYSCPIALSLLRHVKTGTVVAVGIQGDAVSFRDDWYRNEEMSYMPDTAWNWMVDYDERIADATVEPIRFTMDIPDKYIKKAK
jgi:hypothetical protein